MGRTAKPDNLLELSGSFKKDKKRGVARALRVHEPGGPIGAPPAHWAKASSYPKGALEAIWAEYIERFHGLEASDGQMLENLCVATYEGRRTGTKAQLRWHAMMVSELKDMRKMLAARTLLRPPKAVEESRLTAFQRRKQA